MRLKRPALARLMATALLIMTVGVPAAQAQRLVSEKQELEAGRNADEEIRKQNKISNDRNLNGLVNHLGKRLARVSDRPNITWTFRVIDSKDINAFSVPGYVYMNTGLLDTLRGDQDAIAGVIAHEIGHTTGRHAAKQMEKGAIGSLLVNLIGGRNKIVQNLSSVAMNLVMLGYSRDDENDADRRAVRYMIKAEYDPEGLVRFFEMLQKQEGRGSGGIANYFRTHPPSSDRLKRVREEIRKNGEDR